MAHLGADEPYITALGDVALVEGGVHAALPCQAQITVGELFMLADKGERPCFLLDSHHIGQSRHRAVILSFIQEREFGAVIASVGVLAVGARAVSGWAQD